MGRRFPQMNLTVLAVFLLVSVPLLVGGRVAGSADGPERACSDWYGGHLALPRPADGRRRRFLRVSQDPRRHCPCPDARRPPERAQAGSAQPFDAARSYAISTPSGSARDRCPSALAERARQHGLALFRRCRRQRPGSIASCFSPIATDEWSPRRIGCPTTTRSDEDWWKACGRRPAAWTHQRDRRALGRQRPRAAIEVSIPVPEPGSDRLAGVLKAVIDARELLAAVGGLQPGATGQATLLRPNGSIVFSRTTDDPERALLRHARAQRASRRAARHTGPG